MRRMETVKYNNKTYHIPVINRSEGADTIRPQPIDDLKVDMEAPVIRDLNQPFDIERMLEPRTPVSIGKLPPAAQRLLVAPSLARNILDLPIKFPGSPIRLPAEYAAAAPIAQRFADAMAVLNAQCYDEYYFYLTFRRSVVQPGGQHHHAPVHVDGFQGARWNPKHRANHTITVSNCIKTVFFNQPIDLRPLDLAKHDAFWEMNRQVAATDAAHAWTGYDDFDIMLMDAYCPHIAGEATARQERTWVRISAETRIFDRLGNAHNPFFAYNWDMVPRDIEQLNLEPFDNSGDPSLYRFPWQAIDGSVNPQGVATVPKLRPSP